MVDGEDRVVVAIVIGRHGTSCGMRLVPAGVEFPDDVDAGDMLDIFDLDVNPDEGDELEILGPWRLDEIEPMEDLR